MVRIFLIGFMGCGKTSTGRRLAQKIRWQWIDTDRFIEHRHRKNLADFVEDIGEEKFREIEHKILLEVTEFQNVVISCGGGLPCFYDNMEIMKNTGTVIYLKETPENLFERLKKAKTERILLKNKTENEIKNYIFETMPKREKYYEQAHITINPKENFEHIDKIFEEYFLNLRL